MRRAHVPVLQSIRSRIMAGCMALSMLTAGLGLYAHFVQIDIARLATSIYDDAFMGLSYLRSAQVGFGAVAHAGPQAALAPGALDGVLDDLAVAGQRAMSATGRRQVEELRAHLTAALTTAALDAIGQEFETAAETFAGDGFRYRRSLSATLAAQSRSTWIAVIGSILAAILITALVTRLIAPPVRRAALVAQAIADGRLDNAIPPGDASETGDLLRALSVMQGNIASYIGRIHALMEEQASDHRSELSREHTKLEAALGNMNQGLCLFDAQDRLVIANRSFGEMFGLAQAGISARALFAPAHLSSLLPPVSIGAAAAFTCVLPDGRNIAVTHRQVGEGGWVATYEDITARREAEARLAHLARHDQLTGLANRVQLREHMQALLRQPFAPGGIAVLSLDLDRFKTVNDVLGQVGGDEVLHAVARRLRESTRDTDLVVRLGGDEFVVVQTGSQQPAAATTLAQRLVGLIAEPIEVDGQAVSVGASIGIAVSELPSDSAEMLLRSAEIALYRAKADDPGSFCFFEPPMDTLVQARRRLESELRSALALNQFEMHYQPLVNVASGEIEGFEALVRWCRSEQGVISPAVFIPVAEEIGLIGALGEWVINRACFEAAAWPDHIKVAVNLSPAQFRQGTLVDQVEAALQLSGLPAGRLELEITESVLLQDSDAVMHTLFGLRALGVRIAMDDFGTGYSSLSYLRRFPFDKIKIDQSFVRGMVEHEDCRAIVRAVIGLGNSLGMMVNAEGVETAAQCEALRSEGCGQLQGYLFSKPRPGSEVAAMLAGHRNPNALSETTS